MNNPERIVSSVEKIEKASKAIIDIFSGISAICDVVKQSLSKDDEIDGVKIIEEERNE